MWRGVKNRSDPKGWGGDTTEGGVRVVSEKMNSESKNEVQVFSVS